MLIKRKLNKTSLLFLHYEASIKDIFFHELLFRGPLHKREIKLAKVSVAIVAGSSVHSQFISYIFTFFYLNLFLKKMYNFHFFLVFVICHGIRWIPNIWEFAHIGVSIFKPFFKLHKYDKYIHMSKVEAHNISASAHPQCFKLK